MNAITGRACEKCSTQMLRQKNKWICINSDCGHESMATASEIYTRIANSEMYWNEASGINSLNALYTHEYFRIRELLLNRQYFAAFYQMKDFIEILLKLPVVVGLNILYEKKNDPKFEYTNMQKELLVKVHSILSLGHWLWIARELSSDPVITGENEELGLILNKVVELYSKCGSGKGKDTFVSIRNDFFGHGALYFEESVEKAIVFSSVFEKLVEALKENVSLYKGIQLLDGQGQLVGINEIKDVRFNELKIKLGERIKSISPYIVLEKGENRDLQLVDQIFLFDSYNHNQMSILDYINGKKMNLKDIEKIDELKEFLKLIGHEKLTKMSGQDAFGENHIDRKQLDELEKKLQQIRVETPLHFDRALKAVLKDNEKGTFMIRAESGMGKSTFCSLQDSLGIGVNNLHAIHTVATCVHINSIYLYEGTKFKYYAKLKLDRLGGEGYVSTPVESFERNPSDWFAALLKEVKRRVECIGEAEKLLFIIDGLDEIPYEYLKSEIPSNSILDFVPLDNQLEKGIYIVLLQRMEGEIPERSEDGIRNHYNLTPLFLPENIDKKVVCIDSRNQVYRTVLDRFMDKCGVSVTRKEELLESANYKFKDVAVIELLINNLGTSLDEINQEKDFVSLFLKKIKDRYESKYAELFYKVAIVLATAYRPLTIVEIAELLDEKIQDAPWIIAILNDMRCFISRDRTLETTVFSITHKTVKDSVIQNYRRSLRELVQGWYSSMKYRPVTTGEVDSRKLTYLRQYMMHYIIDYFKDEINEENYSEQLADSIANEFWKFVIEETWGNRRVDIREQIADSSEGLFGFYLCRYKLQQHMATQLIKLCIDTPFFLLESLRYHQCIEISNKSIEIIRELDETGKLGDRNNLAKVQMNRANLFYYIARYEEALEDNGKAIEIRRELDEAGKLGDRNDLAGAYMSRAILFRKVTRYEEALADYEKAIEIVRGLDEAGKLRDRNDLATVHMNRAILFESLLRYEEALADYEKAVEIRKKLDEAGKLGDRDDLASVYMNRAILFRQVTRYEEALADYEKAVKIRKKLDEAGKLGNRNDLAKLYMNRAILFRKVTRYEEALADYEKAVKIRKKLDEAGKLGDRNDLASVYMNRAILFRNMTRYEEAQAEYEKALEIIRELDEAGKLGDRNNLASVYMSRAMLFVSLTRYEEALADYEKTEKIRMELDETGKLGDPKDLASVHMNRANLFVSLTRYEEALADYEKAIEIVRGLDEAGKLGDRNDLAMVHMNRAILFEHLLRYEEALAEYEKALEIRKKLDEAGKLGDRNDLAMIFINRLTIYQTLGDLHSATSDIKLAQIYFQDRGDEFSKWFISRINSI